MNAVSKNSILVTGGAGFIGSAVVQKLISSGAKTYCMSRSQARFERFQNSLEGSGIDRETLDDRLLFVNCDLSDPTSIAANKEHFKSIDTLIHLAAEVSGQRDVINQGPAQVDLELKGTINLLNAMPTLERVCYASSMAVYGRPFDNPVTESTRTEPENIYGVCKLTMEKLFKLFSEHEGVPVNVVRFSSVYGPGNTSARAIPTFIKKLLAEEDITVFGDGNQLRDYVYVDDAAEAVIQMLDQRGFNIYNIGAGSGTSTNDLLATLKKLTGKIVEVEYKALPDSAVTFDFVYDISKAGDELAYEPQIKLEDGLKRELNWHMSEMSS